VLVEIADFIQPCQENLAKQLSSTVVLKRTRNRGADTGRRPHAIFGGTMGQGEAGGEKKPQGRGKNIGEKIGI